MKTSTKRPSGHMLWAAGLVLAVAGCGGGGGDAPPPPPGTVPLALNERTMADAAMLGLSSGEAVLEIGQMATDHARRFAASAAPIGEACANGGTLTLTLTDRDGSGSASAGDRVTAVLRDCGMPLMAQVLGGTVGFEIAAVSPAPTAVLQGTVDFGDGVEIADLGGPVAGVSVRLLGSLAVDASRTALATTVAVASTAADDLRIVGSGGGATLTEAFHAIAATKQLAFDQARATVSMRYRYDSEAMGGSFAVSTPQPLVAYLNTYPEQGRVEVRGAGSAVLAITPNFVSASELFDLALDSDGNGSTDLGTTLPWLGATQGYLWWDGAQALIWSRDPYATRPFNSTTFGSTATAPAYPSATDPVRIQFSRVPRAPAVQPVFQFLDLGSTTNPGLPQVNVPAVLAQDGALWRLWPGAPLRHGRSYAVQMSTDGGATWGTSLTLTDALGNTTQLSGWAASFATPDTMHAVVNASATVLTETSGAITLSAAGSTSARPIARWHWAQVSGPPLVLATPDAATTTVGWAQAPTSPLESAVVELTLTDVLGEVESARQTLTLLRTVVSGRVLYFRSTPGDYIGAGQTALVSDATGVFSGSGTNPGFLTFSYNAPDYSAWWNLWLASADGAPLHVGAYENAVRAAFHGDQNGIDLFGSGRGCNMVVGRFDVIEIAFDGAGSVTRLAVDFEQHCEGAQAPPLFGSLRIDSSVPLRP